ncbi:MAG TPA: response regulator [Blastocatellia bacterium]|nr:response regulator [Blastocatellia bacterium]
MIKVLIVEDNENMRRVIRSVIGELAEVVECEDGRDALAAYARHQPDWVFMDIKMEGVNGIAATREIKAAFPDARIVIVTNYDDAEFREAAFKAGACDHVLKEDLLSLRRIIGQPP